MENAVSENVRSIPIRGRSRALAARRYSIDFFEFFSSDISLG